MADVNLVELAVARAYSALDDAWTDAVADLDGVDLTSCFEAAETLDRQAEGERATALLSLLSEALLQAARGDEALACLRQALGMTRKPEALREDLLACLREAHGARPGFEAYLERSDFHNEGLAVAGRLALLDDYFDFPVGRHVNHAAGWGVGRVIAVDARTGDIEIDFERHKGHRFPVDGACQYLERLPEDGLAARIYSGLDDLKKFAEEDPAALVRLAVQSRDGSATSVQVKKDLVETVVPKKQWSKFWNKAKAGLTHDPHIEIGSGTRPTITIRQDALRFADEIARQVQNARSFKQANTAGKRLVKEIGRSSSDVTAEERGKVLAVLAGRLVAESESLLAEAPATVIEGLWVLERLAQGEPPSMPESFMELRTDLSRFLEVASVLEETAVLKSYVQGIRSAHPEAHCEVFAQALLEAPKGVFQIVLSALKESAPGYIAASLQRLVSVPEPNADALLQLARESFNGRLDAVEGAPPVGRIFEKLLAYTDKTERLRAGGAAGVPNIRPRVKVLFEARKYEVVRKHFQEVDRTNARNTYMRILSSHAIDDGVKEAARVVVARRFPDLLKEKQQYFWEDDNLIFTTRDGLRKLEAELDELLNVRVPENQRAIGAAAAHGDLSENAEYTAALEERDQLIRRAGRVRGEVESARLLEEAEIPVGLVSPGSRVELTEIDTDESRAYTILGPWDVDLEAGVISYTAPLVKGLLGCRPGDEARIVLPGGEEQRFKVLAVEPVLGLHGQDG